jgi:hypothetical protein
MFNLYQTDEDGVLTLIPASDYYGGTAPSDRDDWTEKLDYSEVIEIEPPNRIAGKFYNAKWVDEDDAYHQQYRRESGERYGNYLYEISNTWQRGVNDLEVGFSQSVPVQVTGSDQVIPAIFEDKNGIITPYKGNAPRLFIYNGLVEVPQASFGAIHPSDPAVWGFAPDNEPLFIVDGGSWYYPQFGHTLDFSGAADFDLNFKTPFLRYYDGSLSGGVPSDNLFEEYWRVFIEELTSADAKVLTAYFNLSKLDINNLDFSRLKEVDGVLYRLNLVDNFISTNNISTKCELIKVLKGNSRRRVVIQDGTPPFNPNDSTFMAIINDTTIADDEDSVVFKNTFNVNISQGEDGVYRLLTTDDKFENATISLTRIGRDFNDYELIKNNNNSYTLNVYDSHGDLASGILDAFIEIKIRK